MSDSKYKVENLKDNTYQVVAYTPDPYEPWHGEYRDIMFQGSISDCEAWIRLRKEGYLD